MAEQYSIGLCLLDFIPNIAFIIGGIFLFLLARNTQGNKTAILMLSGAILIFTGGTLKALWKLLYTLGIADIKLFSEAQFTLLAPGFLLMLLATIILARTPAPSAPLSLIAPWKIPFLATMTLCSLGTQGILAYISFKRDSKLSAYFFIVAILCMFGMAGMASGSTQTVANQWIEEVMNTIGQISFATGSFLLYRRSQTFPNPIKEQIP
jgi:hypothetical protein